jgi:hypothetical protein
VRARYALGLGLSERPVFLLVLCDYRLWMSGDVMETHARIVAHVVRNAESRRATERTSDLC